MSDQLEQQMRETLRERAAEVDPAAVERLQAIDYRPRRRRMSTLPTLGALGVAVAVAAVVAVLSLGSSTTPAFAGWSATPTQPAAGELASAEQDCNSSGETPVLTDTRGPFTASIYEDASGSRTCLVGDSMSIVSSNGPDTTVIPAGHVQLLGSGMDNSDGQALTLVDGRIGAGVTSVTINRADGSSVVATVSGGWYLAWWPGTTNATTADVTSATGTVTEQFPPPGPGPGPGACPTGSHCSTGYSFGSQGGEGSGTVSANRSGAHTGTVTQNATASAGADGSQ